MTTSTDRILVRAAREWLSWELDCGDGARLGISSHEELAALPPVRALALVDAWFPGGLAEFARDPHRAQHATRGLELVAGLAVWLRHDGHSISQIAEQFNVSARDVVWWLALDHARSLLPMRWQGWAVRRAGRRAERTGPVTAPVRAAGRLEKGQLAW